MSRHHLSHRSLSWLLAGVALMLLAADWPSFRGPRGNGITGAKDVPTTWGPDENIRWKVKLPQPGNSSPIVSRGHVFLTCAEDSEGKQRSLYCFDADSGKQLWVRTATVDEVMPTHNTNPYCASTPVANGQRVVVWHGSAGVYCYDFEGNEQWSTNPGRVEHMWGYAASPILHEGRVILNFGPAPTLALLALDLKTGNELWRTEESYAGDGQRDQQRYIGTWSTPVVSEVDGQQQIICSMTTRVAGYNPSDGRMIWYCEGLSGPKGDLAYSSPMVHNDVCLIISGFNGPMFATYMGGSGDVTDTNRLWRQEDSPQNIGSGVYLGQHVYVGHAGPGIIECLHAPTGKSKWKARVGAHVWSSVVRAGQTAYVTDQDGATIVFKPNARQFEELAVNQLGEPSNSTPALTDGRIYIRTFEHLYCIGEK